MKKIIVNKNYPIFIGQNLIEKITQMCQIKNYSKAFVITDSDIEPLFLKKILSLIGIDTAYIVLPSGEKEKNIENIQKIWTAMHSAGCDKQSLVVNLGGGVIGDMGGFAASTYMRGVDYLNIPTTLLAQVDASIGGKTGIDFAGIKNLIGTFHQPVAVVIDTQTLATLPKREFLSGFAEIIKHGLIRDKKYYQEVTKKHPLKLSQDELVDIIARSCKIKAEIVESDPRESAYRKLLNFGHTIGHAIESLSLESCAPFLHGEAVSIGMLVEAKISQLDGMLSLPELQRIHQGLIKTDLPVYLTNIEIAKILKKVQSDKKNEKGKVNFTLLQKIGKAVYNQNVSENVIIEAINTYKIK